MAWQDRECKGCGDQFAPTSKNQQYCETCTTQCRVPGCLMQVRARGYCASHLRKVHAVPVIQAGKNGTCGIDGCERVSFCKGYCHLHYDRVRLYGDVGEAVAQSRKSRGLPCEVDGCERPSIGDGLCNRHFARRRRTGETGPAELLRRAMGDGYINETGYLTITINGERVFAHRYMMEIVLGRPLYAGENVHHKNGDRLDNSPDNLEVWISQQPSGQRATDMVLFALRILQNYPELLADEGYRLLALESAEATKAMLGEPPHKDFDSGHFVLSMLSAGS